ncbi:MAG: fibronectin type III domain-containing protein, partial [Acidobacteria bacterium]|nr:fibronectin type III domain-containing protein [Acidobacteriota bacterium]
ANGSMWGLNGTYGIDAPSAWAVTRGSPSTVVAVLDTGSTVHPDLDGTTVPGYDMIVDPAVAADGNGRDADPSDAGDAYGGSGSSWHGTHVAGTINAIVNNGIGVVGIAPDVKVQHVRVLGAGGGYTSDILAGITWASGGSVSGVPANPTPAKVINMSLGGYGSCGPDWQATIDAAVARGTTIVVAAGNSNADASGFSPASCAKVVTVAAIGSNGKRASFSNYGSTVEVAAPGVGIWSTLNTGSTTPGSPTYASYSGTSMATPHVVGVVALMVSREPGLTPAQVTTRLTTASMLTPFPGGACDPNASMTCGAGILNAGRLLGASSSPAATVPAAPTAVAGTPGVGQVQVSWAAPASDGGSAITGYTARAYTALTGGSPVATCTTTTLTCPITGLSSGVTYYVEAVATNAVGTGPASSPRASVAPASVPGAPTSVAAASAAGSASITWVAPASTGGSPITGYTARAFSAATGGTPIATCTSAVPGCTITGLANGTTAYVDVVAANVVGSGAASSPRVSVIPRTVPGSPTGVTASAGNGQISVGWAAPTANGGSAVTGYTASAFTSASGGSAVAGCTSATTQCAITGLANGTTYYVEVTAANAVGVSTPSSPRVAAMPRTTPAAATGVQVTPGAGQLTVAWTAPTSTGGSAITGYVARAFTALIGGTPVATCASATTTCAIAGLANGTSYYVDVIASNAAGTGPATAPRIAGVPRTVPGAPTLVQVTPGNLQLLVTWTAPASTGGSAVTGYTVRAFTSATGGVAAATCATTTTNCTISGLANGTAYAVEVVATNAAGSGPASTPRTTGTPRTTPGSPTGVTTTSGNGQLTVAWAAPASIGGSAIIGYTVNAFTAPTGGTPVRSCTTTGALTCVLTSLTNGVTYYVETVARNAAGVGSVSSPRVPGVPMTIPAATRSVAAAAQDSRALVTWQPPASDGGSPVSGYTASAWTRAVGGTLVSTCTSVTTTCTLPGLVNGTTYYVEVVATNAVGAGQVPSSRVAVLPRTIPQPPVAVQAKFGNGQLSVTWSAPSSNGGSAVTGYTARAFAAESGGTAASSCTSTAMACTIPGLVNGTSYFVEVTATNAVGSSLPSGPRVEQMPRTVPSAPGAVRVTPEAAQLTVAWGAPSSSGGTSITSYTARAFSAASGGGPVSTCTSTGTTCVIDRLVNGQAYYVDVVAVNVVGSGPASTTRVAATPRTVPGAPVAVQVTPGDSRLALSWRAPASTGGSPITSYLARAISGGTQVASCTTSALTCTITGL